MTIIIAVTVAAFMFIAGFALGSLIIFYKAITWCALNAHTFNYANILRNRLTIAPQTSFCVT